MPLEIQPCTEADLLGFARIQSAAFSTGITALLRPQPPTEEFIKTSAEKHVKSFREEPDCHFLKVVDTDLDGKMISCAKWRINEKERTEQQIQGMLPKPGKDEEGNQAAQDFFGYLHEVRSRYMGTKPFYFLHILVTDPAHRRRGAGVMLANWGLERADKAGLPAFVESTEAGKSLYRSLGWEPVKETVFDLAKYGGEGVDKSTAMIRQPVQ